MVLQVPVDYVNQEEPGDEEPPQEGFQFGDVHLHCRLVRDWDQFNGDLDDLGVRPPRVQDWKKHNEQIDEDDHEDKQVEGERREVAKEADEEIDVDQVDQDPEVNFMDQDFDKDSIGSRMGTSTVIDPLQ